ncbi:MAG: cytochrome c [Pseudomonadota bacterium]
MLKYFATLCMIAPYIALSADGLALHQENCTACHAAMTGGDGSLLYTRKDNKIKSSEALTKQINRCQSSLELNWTANQISTVHEYLNSAFYKF